MTASTIILNIFLFIALYIQTLLLFTFFEKKGKFSTDESTPIEIKKYFSATIIVPVFNEEKTLKGTIDSLLQLNYPKDKLKIIIVDDGSKDNTWEIAQQFASNPQIKLLQKENGGKHTAMNFGLKHIDTDLVGCLDADSFVEPNALLEIVKQFQNPEVMAVTPAVRVHEPKNMLQHMQHAEYDMSVFLRKMFGQMNGIHVTPGPFSIFRKEVFANLGDYKKAYNTEDFEITLRMHKNHYPIANAPLAYVNTVTPSTIKGLYKQRLRWIYGYIKNALDYKELILNKKYGNLGMFTLPAALISIVTALYFTGVVLFKVGAMILGKIMEIQTIGFHFFPKSIHFDLFFVNADTSSILTILLISSSVIFVILGKTLSGRNKKINRGLVYFIALYGFIAPVWIFKAVYNVIFGRKTVWR